MASLITRVGPELSQQGELFAASADIVTQIDDGASVEEKREAFLSQLRSHDFIQPHMAPYWVDRDPEDWIDYVAKSDWSIPLQHGPFWRKSMIPLTQWAAYTNAKNSAQMGGLKMGALSYLGTILTGTAVRRRL